MEQATADSILKEHLPFDCLFPAVRKQLQRCRKSSARVGIACSGGPDSVFLLRWIVAALPELRERLIVLHFNHNTRGEASERDAAFVQHIAKTLAVQCIIATQSAAETFLRRDEASLRHARFVFFAEAWSQHGLSLLLTAHHLEDRVESLLMRLSRASALDGLIAPKPVQSFRNGLQIARPMLALDKAQILDCLNRIHQDWREDASNQDTTYYRNFVRTELLPLWKQYRGDSLIQQLSASLAFLEEDAQCLQAMALEAVHGLDLREPRLPLAALRHRPVSIQRRCIRLWLQEHPDAASCSHQQMDALLRMPPGGRIRLTDIWELRHHPDQTLVLQSATPPQAFDHLQFAIGPRSQLWFPDGNCLKCERIQLTPALYQQITRGADDPAHQVHLDAKELANPAVLQVRFWQDGMRYRPLGFAHQRKLKACFIDRKIPQPARKRLPIVTGSQGSIVWVPGLPPAETARVGPDSKDLLRLTYQSS